ncbi:3-phosphoshikimate 1-carboxyvinyltransferase [Rickettsiales bacterium LUAb2]
MLSNNIIVTRLSNKLKGEITPPSDKSISHRSIIFSSLATGVSYINNLLSSKDVEVTIQYFKQLGVIFTQLENNNYRVEANGLQILNNKKYKFDLGNSGTSARLLMGVTAALEGEFEFTGDKSLSKRPMYRVIEPLTLMGANIVANNNYLPIKIIGKQLHGISYTMNVASAQVKSSILLAGLFTNDKVEIVETSFTRDHTENMLIQAGVDLKVNIQDNKKIITLSSGKKSLKTNTWNIPSDFSSAAFIIVAALLVKDSEVKLNSVNLNPLRSGLLKVLLAMGANIKVVNNSFICGEPVGDIIVKYSRLQKAVVKKESVPSMIDEFPILSVLAAFAEGESIFYGVEELRYKESDRIQEIEDNFAKLGIKTKSTKDTLHIWGNKEIKAGGITINSKLDHRIAMSFAIMGLACNQPITIKDANTINTSFANFVNIIKEIGGNIDTE